MGRPCTLLLGLSFLLAATGCQLTAPDNLSSVSSPASTAPQAELPARKTAEVCVATAEELEKAGKDKEAISLYEKARQTGTSKPVGAGSRPSMTSKRIMSAPWRNISFS